MRAHPFDEFPKHLHKAGRAPIIAHDRETEQDARDRGYGDEYVHQPYPKAVGNAIAHNAEEEAELKAAQQAPDASDQTPDSPGDPKVADPEPADELAEELEA